MKSYKTLVYLLEPEQKPQSENSTIHHPIIITSGDNEIANDLKELCAKGPSFIPTFMTSTMADVFFNRHYIRSR